MKWVKQEDAGMGYQNFSVLPLTADNEETRLRIQQLRSDFVGLKGMSVLDIGCHAGLASLLALESGAKEVLAIDVTNDYLPKLKEFAESQSLPLAIEKIDFLNLSDRHVSDVVVFLEVYHWLSTQGIEPQEVSRRLDLLARKMIFFESLVDRSDPSVLRSHKQLNSRYRLWQVFEYLISKNWSAEFLGLTKYFPAEYLRGRFLLKRKKDK